MRLLLRGRARPVRFLYAPAFAGSGTTVMRGAQLAELATATPLSDRGVSFEPFTGDFRGSDLFLTKGAAREADETTLRRWKRRGNRVFADPVDEELSDLVSAFADVTVAASLTAFDSYREARPNGRVALLNHHVDPRALAAVRRSTGSPQEFSCAYFGEPANTLMTPGIAALVEFVPVDTSRPSDEWFARLPGRTMHYAIRQRRALDRYKPFLKGFTAAAASANILIQDSEVEASRWLPPDYPYWLHGEPSEKAVITALAGAREDFGSARWRSGQEMMRDIAERTSPAAIARELVTLFSA